MQKNWYMVYHRPGAHRKVLATLKKLQIESFCPHTLRDVNSSASSKKMSVPLFKNYLFANLAEIDFSLIKKVENIINIVYWMGQPARIKREEIEAIKEFTALFSDIQLKKMDVNNSIGVAVVDNPTYAVQGNLVSVNNEYTVVTLPSLGYTMTGELERKNVFVQDMNTFQKKSWRPLLRIFNLIGIYL
jgi:transcription antitermination factor NusG